jgi:acetyl-CoA carboxylase biotin carboxylase subunit
MFRRVMVANRGEIARRIIRTLKKMNIEAVALYSEADKEAPYLKEAQQSICIGKAAAKDSYLCQEAILEAALQSDCEALHPGFGFLSENALFARRCEQQKLTFIGPKPEHISAMGDKAVARKTMKSLGVPILEGSDGLVLNYEDARSIAQKISYPVMLKARSGGGGRGMRLVKAESELKSAFESVQREALAAFGDQELYIEHFVSQARHIEFQVLGDTFGNVVTFGERECSVQRKNQKLIEEAPANNFDNKLRQELISVINTALKKLGYCNVGTLEFLLGKDNSIHFMEMNTRLQVEHPVTELVYGIDLVEWQVRVACNEQLSFSQDMIERRGAAIECRINAEDINNNFKPSPGLIKYLKMPSSSPEGPVRIDSAIEENSRIVPFYDSMIAKLITFAKSRAEALELMSTALKEFNIDGVDSTIGFHRAVMRDKDFLLGTYDCSFVETHLERLLADSK